MGALNAALGLAISDSEWRPGTQEPEPEAGGSRLAMRGNFLTRHLSE